MKKNKKVSDVVCEIIFTFNDDSQSMGCFGFTSKDFSTKESFARVVHSIVAKREKYREIKLLKASCCVDTTLSTDQKILSLLLRENKKHWYIQCDGKLWYNEKARQDYLRDVGLTWAGVTKRESK